jgi:hypothetical protein
MRVVNRRKFALHGNVDPEREEIEVVYFDGRRPLFVEPGNNIVRVLENMERIHDPKQAGDRLREHSRFLA